MYSKRFLVALNSLGKMIIDSTDTIPWAETFFYESKILILTSKVKYIVTTTHRNGARLKTREKNANNEKKIDADLVLKSINSLRSISRKEKKRQANEPLYLIRYE